MTVLHSVVCVAYCIAQGAPPVERDPPEWLIPALQHFIEGTVVTGDTKSVIRDMLSATDTLLKWLPGFQRIPWGIKPPDYVWPILAALPQLKTDLEKLSVRRKGRPPNIGREVCAAVIVEAWKLVHGKVQPQSKGLLEACNMYWRVCGGAPIGQQWNLQGNWKGMVKKALAEDYSWIRKIMEGYRDNANSPSSPMYAEGHRGTERWASLKKKRPPLNQR
jgi:hypothetical protein